MDVIPVNEFRLHPNWLRGGEVIDNGYHTSPLCGRDLHHSKVSHSQWRIQRGRNRRAPSHKILIDLVLFINLYQIFIQGCLFSQRLVFHRALCHKIQCEIKNT